MKLEQKIARCIDETEHLKQYVTRFDVSYADHEVTLFTKEIKDAEVRYDLQDETDQIEEEIGFTFILADDTEPSNKKIGIPYP